MGHFDGEQMKVVTAGQVINDFTDISEFAQLSVSVLACVGGFLNRIGEILCFISRFIKALVGICESGVVGVKFTLHSVQSRLRVVQLNLPTLSSAVVLAE